MKTAITVGAGGIFSKFMFFVQNAAYHGQFDAAPFCHDPRATANGNPFRFVIDGIPDEGDVDNWILARHLGNYTSTNRIEDSVDFEAMRAVVHNIKLGAIFDRPRHDIPMVGVHIRLTDMDTTHPEYGTRTISDYFAAIDSMPRFYKLYVASDNEESIHKMIDRYGLMSDPGQDGRVVYIQGMLRAKTENDIDQVDIQINNMSDSVFWREAFMDMIGLSRCEYIIGRTSNLFNAAILYADRDVNIVRI